MNKNDIRKNVHEITIAALLHDVGKFMQRSFLDESLLQETTYNMKDYICPQGKYGTRTHRHSLWTYEFFERNILKIPSGLDRNRIQKLASFHHNPEDDFAQHIIQRADWLSSGLDRTSPDEVKGNSTKYYETPLISIFSEVRIHQEKPQKMCYNLSPLTFDESIFPVPINKASVNKESYQKQWKAFEKDLRKINMGDVKIFIGSLLAVLRKYTWCIPSATYGAEPDISLYDHMLTSASIASSLYAYHAQRDETNQIGVLADEETKKFILISGDLSGIQRFIFDVKQEGSKGVSKILRGRSFYIAQMTSAAVHYIIDSLELTPVNKIMDAGGRFTLLVPNTRQTRATIANCRKDIEEYCLERFSGQLALIIDDGVTISQDDLKIENYSKVVSTLIAFQMEKAKKQPLLGAFRHSSFVREENYDNLQKNGSCKICGKEPSLVPEGQGEQRGSFCQFAFEIGKDLPKANYIILKKTDERQKSTDFWGKYKLFLEKGTHADEQNITYIEKINDFKDRVFPVTELSNHTPTYTEYDIREMQYDEDPEAKEHQPGDIKTFAHIAQGSQGIRMLGILKADMDNMGFIFRSGFPKNKYSLSRIVSLSRCINFFFTTYLSRYLESDYPDTYTLFAGGDDLCLIGPWDRMIDLAKDLREKFHKYTAGNSDITLSAGLHFAKPNYPAGKAIFRADEVLDVSKESGKNCLTMFNYSARWGTELDTYFNLRDDLMKETAREDSPIKSASLYRLLKYHKEYLSLYDPEHPDPRGALWLSHFRYDTARNILDSKPLKKQPERKKEVEEIFNAMMASHSRDGIIPMEKLPLALFPVIFARRKAT